MPKILAIVIVLLAGLAIAAADARGILGRRGGVFVPLPVYTLTGANFGTPLQYNGNVSGNSFLMDGDTFGNTWSDDGTAYTMVNDSHGPGTSSGYSGNVMIGKVNPFSSAMTWTLVNQMAAWGTFAQYTAGCSSGVSCPTGASHKTGGLISVQNNLYTANWRLDQTNGGIGYDGTLLKSTNHGASISGPGGVVPVSAAPFPNASLMWPGYDYPIGWVQYGQNYTGTTPDGVYGGYAMPDNSAAYVYATVRNTSGGATTNPRLGRVAIANIANQSIGDWSYYQGPAGADGTNSANWGPLSSAYVMFPGAASADTPTSIQYLPRYQAYVAFMIRSVGTNNYVWDVYSAAHPWGPWTQLGTSPNWNPSALSFPMIAPKSLVNGGQSVVVLASSSQFTTGCTTTSGYYCLWQVPVSFTP